MSESPLKLQVDAKDWGIVPLKNASVFIKDGTHGTHERVQAGIPLLSAKNISPFGKITINEDDSLISEDEYQKIHSKYELTEGDLLLTVVGTLGRSALINSPKRFSIQRSIGVIRCSESKVVPEFLYQFTGTDYFQGQLVLRSNATAQAGVYLGELAKIEVPRPPLPEQQKIAAILSSVDDVIEKTRAQSDKLKDLKTGMMQELLTNGIGSGGVPHTKFKDSPVGRIPASWTVKPLGDLADKISDGIHTTPTYIDKSGYRFVNGNNLKNGHIYIGESAKYVPESEYLKHGKQLTSNTILMSINGTIGNLAYYRGEKVVLGKSAAYISLKGDQSKEFVYFVLQSQSVKTFYDFELTGSTINNLSLRSVKETPIPVPPPSEQEKIANILTDIDDELNLKNHKVSHLNSLKRALMQDLLTGKVRVKVDQKESAVA